VRKQWEYVCECHSNTKLGHTLGRELEADFTRKAKESGLSDEETKNAFNQNMLSTGLLADGPREYSETFLRRWLVAAYEAGDVVLHTPYTVSHLLKIPAYSNMLADTCVYAEL
jgi:hypothetical protein